MSRLILVLALLGALGALQLARAQCLGFQCPPRTLGAGNSGGAGPPPVTCDGSLDLSTGCSTYLAVIR